MDGEALGIMLISDALAKAEEAALDLVEVAPNADPPVCRIMDYGKFKYEKLKRKGIITFAKTIQINAILLLGINLKNLK